MNLYIKYPGNGIFLMFLLVYISYRWWWWVDIFMHVYNVIWLFSYTQYSRLSLLLWTLLHLPNLCPLYFHVSMSVWLSEFTGSFIGVWVRDCLWDDGQLTSGYSSEENLSLSLSAIYLLTCIINLQGWVGPHELLFSMMRCCCLAHAKEYGST